MRIDPFVRDLPQFHANLAQALDSAETRIYLDTSTLMWLVRLSKAARHEFMSWCGSRTTVVPVWAAHEFQRHLLMGTVRANMAKVVNETASKQREFAQIAAEQADDALCLEKGYGQRNNYIAEIQRLMAGFNQLGRVLEVDDDRLRIAADEVIEFINGRSLGSDLDSIIAELSATGDFRLGHRVPPGYQDAHKGQNFLGDAVIWREILQDIERVTKRDNKRWSWTKRQRRDKPVAGVLISRDEKTDWVSTSMVRKADGNVVKSDRELELDVALPHPLLCHEFERQGGADFFLVHPAALSGVVEAMLKQAGLPPTIGSWRAASLRPDVLEKLLAQAAREDRKAQAVKAKASAGLDRKPGSVRPASPQPLTPAASGARKVDLSTIDALQIMRGSISQEVQKFANAGPDARDEILARWKNSVNEGALAATKLGRILARVAIEVSGVEIAQVPATLEAFQHLLPNLGDQLLLGALCAAYFDESGEALKRPIVDLALVLLSLEDSAAFEAAFVAVQRMLADVNAGLPYAPGSKRNVKVTFSLSNATASKAATLQDVRLDGESVLVDGISSSHSRNLSTLLGMAGSNQCKAGQLLGLLSQEYLIPLCRLEMPGQTENKTVSWREDAGLQPIDTYAPKGIGDLNEEDY